MLCFFITVIHNSAHGKKKAAAAITLLAENLFNAFCGEHAIDRRRCQTDVLNYPEIEPPDSEKQKTAPKSPNSNTIPTTRKKIQRQLLTKLQQPQKVPLEADVTRQQRRWYVVMLVVNLVSRTTVQAHP